MRKDLAGSDTKRKRLLQHSLISFEADRERSIQFELEMDKFEYLRKGQQFDIGLQYPLVELNNDEYSKALQDKKLVTLPFMTVVVEAT